MYTKKTHGALGVVVIAIALVGALFGAYFAGITGEEHDVVKYNYLADISGLFEYDKSPQYIEFDPSSNYTGYFSSTSGGYWPDEMSYVPYTDSNGNPRVNNYKINQPPVSQVDTTGDLSGLSITDAAGFDDPLRQIEYFIPKQSWDQHPYLDRATMLTTYCKSTTLLDTLTSMSYDGRSYIDYDVIRISSTNGLLDVSGTVNVPLDTGWVVFTIPNWITLQDILFTKPWMTVIDPTMYDGWTFPSAQNIKAPLCLSCEIDMTSQMVKLYQNNDFTGELDTVSISSVTILHGDTHSSLESPNMTLSETVDVQLIDYPPSAYLDPMQGVHMED